MVSLGYKLSYTTLITPNQTKPLLPYNTKTRPPPSLTLKPFALLLPHPSISISLSSLLRLWRQRQRRTAELVVDGAAGPPSQTTPNPLPISSLCFLLSPPSFFFFFGVGELGRQRTAADDGGDKVKIRSWLVFRCLCFLFCVGFHSPFIFSLATTTITWVPSRISSSIFSPSRPHPFAQPPTSTVKPFSGVLRRKLTVKFEPLWCF